MLPAYLPPTVHRLCISPSVNEQTVMYFLEGRMLAPDLASFPSPGFHLKFFCSMHQFTYIGLFLSGPDKGQVSCFLSALCSQHSPRATSGDFQESCFSRRELHLRRDRPQEDLRTNAKENSTPKKQKCPRSLLLCTPGKISFSCGEVICAHSACIGRLEGSPPIGLSW